jgi:uncharacterized membrane protein YccC
MALPGSRPRWPRFLAFGLELGGAVALGAVAGHWLDTRLGTTPGLTLTLVFGGAGGAIFRLIRLLERSAGTPPGDRDGS